MSKPGSPTKLPQSTLDALADADQIRRYALEGMPETEPLLDPLEGASSLGRFALIDLRDAARWASAAASEAFRACPGLR